ncbi:MAG: heme ABC exporter ATP-binding protein CcmA [Alphaproteobacteria bacterium]|nr:heme ABC exporter ATP-binding protein CcmA [Alphaproteobacteria bacterium]
MSIEGKNISCSRGGIVLVSDFSFSIKKGEQLAIKGANGSGKSTLIRLIAGLIPSPADTLFWEGEMVSKSNLSLYQQNLLYVGHKLCLYPQARVLDQLRLWQNLHKIPLKDMEQALNIWGVGALKDKQISHLSHGQQKRLSLSRCHWLKRRLWILDEPESGLDQEGHAILTEALSAHLGNGGCIVRATHDNREMANTVVVASSLPSFGARGA